LIFRGSLVNTFAIKTFFGVQYYRGGYCGAKYWSPSQASSQKQYGNFYIGLKEPFKNKLCFTPISPFHKGESVGIVVTCDHALCQGYFLCNNSCHTPPYLSLNNHLPSKHLFLISNNFTTKTPIFRPKNNDF
jgi:hypothetical protein